MAVIAAIPVLIIATGHVEEGLSLLLGALPAASIMDLPPTCKQRRKMIINGILRHILNLGSYMAHGV
jgi:hypothetical protein